MGRDIHRLTKIANVKEVVKFLAERYDTSKSQVFDCYRCFIYFQKSRSNLEAFMKPRERVYWVQILTLMNTPDTSQLDNEELLRKLNATIKRTIEKIDKACEELDSFSPSQKARMATNVILMNQSIDRLKVAQTYNEDPFPRSEDYLAKVRMLPCAVTGEEGVHAHHMDIGTPGMKGSDYSCIPLRPDLHDFYTRYGQEAFEHKYNVNCWELITNTLHKINFNTTIKTA